MAEEAGGLRIESRGPVVEVTIARGTENLMSMAMCRQLGDLLTDPPDGIRILHLRADGPVFCLGRDRGGGGPDILRTEADVLVTLNEALTGGELVTVAEVHGDAAGFGVGLAALCDLSFVAPSARLWFPEVNAGLAPAVVLAWLPHLVGRSRAFQLTATGVPVDGRRAAEIGLVTGVAASGQALPGLVAEQIGALLSHDGRVQQEIRAFLRDSAGMGLSGANRLAVDRLTLGALRIAGSLDGGGSRNAARSV